MQMSRWSFWWCLSANEGVLEFTVDGSIFPPVKSVDVTEEVFVLFAGI